MKNIDTILKGLLVVGLLTIIYLTCSSCSNEEIKPGQQHTSIEGSWSFSSSSAYGEFTVEERGDSLVVTTGYFTVANSPIYFTVTPTKVTENILLYEFPKYFTLVNYRVSASYDTIYSDKIAFKASNTIPIYKDQLVVAIRK